jgi:hypothetical protein
MLTILCWGLNKGFDPNLEGFYMLSYQHPELYPTFSSFHILLSKLPRLSDSLILHYRILEVIARVGPPMLLSIGFFAWAKKWLRLDQGQLLFAVVFACIGGLLSFTSCPRTISYNGFSAALVFLSAACTFVGVTNGETVAARAWRLSLLFLAGALAGVAFFVKCTSACILLPVLIAFVLFNGVGEKKTKNSASVAYKLTQSAAIIFGAIASVGWYFTCVETPHQWWQAFHDAISVEAQTSHKLTAVFHEFTGDFGHFWRKGCALLAAGLILNGFVSRGGIKARLAMWFVAAASCVALFAATKTLYFVGKEAYVPLMATAVACCMIPWRPRKSELFRGGLVLFLLPLIATVGTNCAMLGFITSNLSPFFVLMSVAFLVASRTSRAPYAVAMTAIAFSIFCAVEFSQSYVTYRYDCDALNEQTATVGEMTPMKGIAVTPAQVDFYQNAKKVLQANGFVPGDPLVGLYDLPGLNYALDAASPGQAFFVGWPERDLVNYFYLKNSKLNAGPRLFVALNGDDPQDQIVQPRVRDAFNENGVPFPQSFKEIGRIRGSRGDDTVYLYKRIDPVQPRTPVQ